MANEAVKIALEQDCTIYEVSEKHHQIVEQWSKSGSSGIRLDLSAVGEMDVCFIQMLISCEQSAKKQERSFELLNVSDELKDKFTKLAALNLLEGITDRVQA